MSKAWRMRMMKRMEKRMRRMRIKMMRTKRRIRAMRIKMMRTRMRRIRE